MESQDKIPLKQEESIEVDLSGSIEPPVLKTVHYTSFSQRIKALDFPGGNQVKDWFFRQRDGLRPWSEFANTSRFSKPKSVSEAGKRALSNVHQYRSNYFYVVMGVIVFCLFTSPILLLVLGGALFACYVIKKRNKDSKIMIMGRELNQTQQYLAVGGISFPLLWLAGMGSAIFWIIGASASLIALHSSFHDPPSGDTGDIFGENDV